jgi:hypothetical protein
VNLKQLKDSTPKGAAVKFFRTKYPETQHVLVNEESGFSRVFLEPKKGFLRSQIPIEWASIDDFEIQGFDVIPIAGWLKRSELNERGWTPKLIKDHLGDPHNEIETTKEWSRYRSFAHVWALNVVLELEKSPEIQAKLQKTLKTRSNKAEKEAEQKRLNEEAVEKARLKACKELSELECDSGPVVIHVKDGDMLVLLKEANEYACEILAETGFRKKPMDFAWKKTINAGDTEKVEFAIRRIKALFAQRIAHKSIIEEFAEKVWPGLVEEFNCHHYRMSREKAFLVLRFDYDTDAVTMIRKVPDAKWDSIRKLWLLPLENLNEVRKALGDVRRLFQGREDALKEKLRKLEDQETERQKEKAATGMGTGYIWGVSRMKAVIEGHVMWQTLFNGEKQVVKVVRSYDPYYCAEPIGYGSPDESLHWCTRYEFIKATDEEAGLLLAEEQSAQAKLSSSRELDDIHADIIENGEEFWGDEGGQLALEGEYLDLPHNPKTSDGGGAWFVRDDLFIWAVKNNGRENDFWAINNIRTGGHGAVGRRVPFDEALWNQIKSAHSIYQSNEYHAYLEV